MIKPSLRGYVWFFCIYLVVAVKELDHRVQPVSPRTDLSFFLTLFPQVIAPVLIAVCLLAMLSEFKNSLIKAVLLLTSLTFVSNGLSALHRYGYISFAIPHWVSTFFWLTATVLLGYRTNQLLRQYSQEIEAN